MAEVLAGQALDEASSSATGSTVTVMSLTGRVLAEVTPVPATVGELKAIIEEKTDVPVALQKLISDGDVHIYSDEELLAPVTQSILLVHDETALFTWDLAHNPCCEQLCVETSSEGGSILTCPGLASDYVNVLTQEPLRSGVHYFQFLMHKIGDEQWCGVVADSRIAGRQYSGRNLRGWTYYCGRMNSGSSSIKDGKGALHAEGHAVVEFQKLNPSGDVIGMLVDCDVGALAFELNGTVQGACKIPKEPLYVLTHMDQSKDKVELRKPPLPDAPQASLEALKGAMLDISSGELLNHRNGFQIHTAEC
eukprot:CAMPEP_0115091666 /NCGR_PEP_ID=MMETSP0227-20121206/26255_1 /TAXON_ID=89957 /ORGANISM="Polarella glacialis, Strain CCMP 1383" /LENGTH=306 /DNA_ID=CAMNT_0002483235 /DNA_START=105 /DNA_END=1025 /DNA_ORIENTATION=+